MKINYLKAGFARPRADDHPARQHRCRAGKHEIRSVTVGVNPTSSRILGATALGSGLKAGFARLFFALWLCFTLLPLSQSWAQPDRVHVASVIDGDTLRLTDGRSLRLAGIDSPELSHNKVPGQAKDQLYALESRDLLRRVASGKPLELRLANAQGKDRHKRVLAEALLPDGTSLNEYLLREGAAYAYWHKDLNHDFWQRMLRCQQKALREKRGLWAKLLAHPVANAPYVGNRNSQRFFPEDCKEARHIKPDNRVPFADLTAAFMAGFAPARVCVFWPTK